MWTVLEMRLVCLTAIVHPPSTVFTLRMLALYANVSTSVLLVHCIDAMNKQLTQCRPAALDTNTLGDSLLGISESIIWKLQQLNNLIKSDFLP